MIEAKVDDIIIISQKENPSTGYSFFNPSVTSGLEIIEDIHIKNKAPPEYVGVGGVHTWKIKVTQPGAQKFSVWFGKKWNENTWEKYAQLINASS